ncbi:hypothetical protein PJL18_04443 [Paenarthrobacter nicotinovorans]|nr:hypothetical protein [Paenarthrobacter nicotinovorans]
MNGRVGSHLGEESVPGGVPAGLLDDNPDLAGCGHLAVFLGRAQGRNVALDGPGNVGRAAGDVFPLLHGVRGHEVENGADVLGGRGDVVQVRGIPAGLVDLKVQTQPLAHGVEGDGVHIIGRLKACQGVQGQPCGLRMGCGPGRRVVLVLRFVPWQAQRGGETGIEFDQLFCVRVSDGINGGLWAYGGVCSSHPQSLTASAST